MGKYRGHGEIQGPWEVHGPRSVSVSQGYSAGEKLLSLKLLRLLTEEMILKVWGHVSRRFWGWAVWLEEV